MSTGRTTSKNKEHVGLRLDEQLIQALDKLEPGFGNNTNEVIRHIVTDWIKDNMGIEWMKDKGLLK